MNMDVLPFEIRLSDLTGLHQSCMRLSNGWFNLKQRNHDL